MPSCVVFHSLPTAVVAGCLALALIATAGSEARAAAEPVHVRYEADAGCPTRGRFVEEILARTRKATVVGPEEARRIFVVTVRATGTGFVGRLEIKSGSDSAAPREISGPTCAAVTSALALVAALAIDPDSLRSTSLRSELDAPAESRSANPPGEPPPPQVLAAAPTSRETLARTAPRWRIGAQAQALSPASPSVAFGGAAFAELELGPNAGTGMSLGLPTLRLTARYARTATVHRAEAAAQFDWGALGLEACFARVRLAPRVDWQACGAFDAGFLRGQGDELALTRTPVRPWFSAGPLLRFQWFFRRPWFFDAEAELVVPLRRETFVLDQPSTAPTIFYEVAPLGGGAGIGLGFELGDRDSDLRP